MPIHGWSMNGYSNKVVKVASVDKPGNSIGNIVSNTTFVDDMGLASDNPLK